MLVTTFSSYIFNLITLTFVALWISYRILNVPISTDKNLRKTTLYNWFLWLSVFAVLAQFSYVFAPKRIFSNASHHAIEHLGFSFNQKLELVNSESPNQSIFDEKRGGLSINQNGEKFNLNTNDFNEPIYVKKGDDFVLSNAPNATPITKQLEIILNDSLTFSLLLNLKDKVPYSIKTKVKNQEFGTFDVPISQVLQSGYSLADMLRRLTNDAPNMADIVSALDSSWIVRLQFNRQNKTFDNNPLLLFPSASLLSKGAKIYIDGKEINFDRNLQSTIGLAQNQPFYLGLWHSQVRIFELEKRASHAEITLSIPYKKISKKIRP